MQCVKLSTITSSLGLHDYHILYFGCTGISPHTSIEHAYSTKLKKFYVKNLRPGPLVIGKDDIHAQYMY